MHVVQLLPELEEGGVERAVVDINRGLVQRGVTSTVISWGGRLVAQVEADGGRHVRINVCSKNPLTFLFRAWQLRRTLAALAPDVVHVHSRLPAWLLRVANHGLGLPVVTTVHGLNRAGFYSRILTRGTRVICVSQAVRAYVQRHYGLADAALRVVYFGADAAAFNPARLKMDFVERFRREQRLDGRFVVTSAGRLAPCKDYETFIRGVLAARQQIPGIVGVIVGGVISRHREYARRLHDLVQELGAGDVIRFAGQHDAMAEIYALSDVLVSCSAKPESFGRTLAEALAMNTPVIATAHGGAVEVVRDGVDGFLFSPRDVAALARCLAEVQREAGHRNLRESVLQRFGLDQAIDVTQVVYSEAIAARTRAVSVPEITGPIPLADAKLLAGHHSL